MAINPTINCRLFLLLLKQEASLQKCTVNSLLSISLPSLHTSLCQECCEWQQMAGCCLLCKLHSTLTGHVTPLRALWEIQHLNWTPKAIKLQHTKTEMRHQNEGFNIRTVYLLYLKQRLWWPSTTWDFLISFINNYYNIPCVPDM